MKKIIKIAVIVVLSFVVNKAGAQGMAVNSTGAVADNSAMLDVQSNAKGVLIPRMTSTSIAAITSPATGLLVFQTDGTPGFYYYNGTAWTAIAGTGGATGSAGGDLAGTYPNPTIAATVAAGNDIVAAVNVSTVTVSGTHLSDSSIPVKALSVTGTASSSTYLSGNGTWSTPSTSTSTGVNGMVFSNSLISGTLTPEYMPVSGGTLGTSAVLNDPYIKSNVMPFAGTMDALYVTLVTESASTSGANVFTVYKNGSATTLTCSVTNSTTAYAYVTNNGTGSVTFVAGDIISIQIVPFATANVYEFVTSLHMH